MTQEELAKDWLSRASGKWRLQVLQRRGRNVPKGGSEWERRELPLRLRRFLNGTPVGLVHDVLRLLDTDTSLRDPVFNWEPAGTVPSGAEPDRYKAVRTYIVKDGNPNESNGKDPTYTIVQDLRLADDNGDDLGITDTSACSQESETRYVWDASDVEPAPPGGQGVSWRVTNVTRDQETDLYSYQLRREVAITQHQEPQVTECGEFETVTQESWDNLYGEPGAFEDQDRRAVNVPEPCDAPDGTTVRVQVSENPDCTFKVVVTKSVAKRATQLTEARKSLRGVTETVRTVATSPMPETGLELGEQVRNELRPDGKYDVTHVTASRESVGDIGSDCERTVFEHRHDEVRNEAGRPEDEAGVAGGGRVYRVQSRATEEGTWDVTRSETEELRAEKARHSKRKTLRGVTESWTDRNVADNGVAVTDIGDEVVVEETPGGLWNRTVTKVTKESVGDVGSNCEKTVFEHRHVRSENVATRPEEEASRAGGGKTYQVQARATEEGTWDVSRTETTEIVAPYAQHMRRRTLRGTVESWTDRNVGNGDVTVTDIGDEVRVEETPGGLWNRTVTHVVPEPVGEIARSCSANATVHTDVTLSNVPDGSQPDPFHQSPAPNVERSVETRLTDEGTWDVTDRTVVHAEVLSYGHGGSDVATVETADRTISHHAVVNAGFSPVVPAPEDGEARSGMTARYNEHGSIDASWQELVAKPKEEWDAEVSANYEYRRTVWFRNASMDEYKAVIARESAAFDAKLDGWIAADRPAGGHSVVPSVQATEFVNRFDGSVTCSATWSNSSAGQFGSVNEVIFSHDASTTETVYKLVTERGTGGWRTRHKAVAQRNHFVTEIQGRGRQALINAISSIPKLGTFSDNFSYNANDSTWSFTRTETTNMSPLEED